jgi:hypothetical protein
MYTNVKSQLSRFNRGEDGQVTAWFVAVLILLFAIMALSIDVGFWFVDRRHAQNQVDAAVLAGVQELEVPKTALEIQTLAALNPPQGPVGEALEWLNRNNRIHQSNVESSCGPRPSAIQSEDYDLVVRGFAFADTDNDLHYDKIRACVERGSFLLFARLLGLSNIEANAVAAAGLSWEPSRYALMAMNDTDCSRGSTLDIHTSTPRPPAGVYLGNDGESYTAGSCGSTDMLSVRGSGVLDGGGHDVCGTGGTSGAEAILEPEQPQEGVCGLPDPWISYDQPVPDPICELPGDYGITDFIFEGGSGTPTQTLNPGTYCLPVSVKNGWTVTLSPGTYVFRAGLMVDGGSLLGGYAPDGTRLPAGAGVVLYFTCSTGDECGGSGRPPAALGCSVEPAKPGVAATFCIQGDSTVKLGAPEALPHIVVWVDRTAVAATEEALVRLAGSGDLTFDGHVYAWSGEVIIQGSGTGLNVNQTGTVLGDTIDIGGSAAYNITWDDQFAPRITSLALVE